MNVAACIPDVSYRLGYLSTLELTSGAAPWVTVDELYQFADDAAKQLSYNVGLFVTWDASIQIVPGVSVYTLPEAHVFTLLAAIQSLLGGDPGGSAGLWGGDPWGSQPWGPSGTPVPPEVLYQLLRITRAKDLWALDGNWPTTSGNPLRISLDANSVGTATTYPIPIGGSEGTLVQILQVFPAEITAAAPDLIAPSCLQDYLSYAMLAGARGKESEYSDDTTAAHYRKRLDLYDQVFTHLWGPGQ